MRESYGSSQYEVQVMRCQVSNHSPVPHSTINLLSNPVVGSLKIKTLHPDQESKRERILMIKTLLVHLLVHHRLALWGRGLLVMCASSAPTEAALGTKAVARALVATEAGRFASRALTTICGQKCIGGILVI